MAERDLDQELVDAFAREHPIGTASALERLDDGPAAEVLRGLDEKVAGRVVAAMLASRCAAAMQALEPADASRILAAAGAVAAARVLRRVADDAREPIVQAMPKRRRTEVTRLLESSPGTAASIMDPSTLVVAPDATVETARALLADESAEGVGHVYVVARNGTLDRAVPIAGLVTLDSSRSMASLDSLDFDSVLPTASLESVVDHPAWEKQDSLPVVDANGLLLGEIRQSGARRVARDLGKATRAPDSSETTAALAEFYGVALASITDLVGSVLSPGEEARRD